MKRILLTTTSLVLAAGVAQADITWSGSATAGMAKTGKVKAVAAAGLTNKAVAGAITDTTVGVASAVVVTDVATYQADVLEQVEDIVAAVEGVVDDTEGDVAVDVTTAVTETIARANIALLTREISLASGALSATVAAAQQALLDGATAMLDNAFGAAETAAGKMTQYSEVNAAASASVATDMGWTITVGASLDVGNGYDFADDDGFDGRTAGSVSLDTVAIDFGAGGVLSLNDNGMAHLVDADDDAAADLKYTNTFGTASFAFVADIDDGDSDHLVTAASVTWDATNSKTVYTAASAAADVQWSAKVSMPLAGTNVYFAADEEGGDAYGVSGTYAGLGWSVDSKREAAEKDANKDRSNTVGVTYAAGALTMGATYNSIKDGDQWGVSAGYAAGALSLNLSTDEGSDWSASGAYDLGNGASLVGGTNYTEDAYVGVSFAF